MTRHKLNLIILLCCMAAMGYLFGYDVANDHDFFVGAAVGGISVLAAGIVLRELEG